MNSEVKAFLAPLLPLQFKGGVLCQSNGEPLKEALTGTQRSLLFENIAELLNDEYSGDKIHLTWCVDDVLERAKEDEAEITKEEARSILADIEHGHDASIGVNWETISIYIDMFVESRDKKEA